MYTIRQMILFNVPHRLRRMWQNPGFARGLHYSTREQLASGLYPCLYLTRTILVYYWCLVRSFFVRLSCLIRALCKLNAGDIWLAPALKSKSEEERMSTGFISWTADAAPFQKNNSCSPVVGILFNMCPTMRFTPGGLLTLAFFPKKTKKTNMQVQCVDHVAVVPTRYSVFSIYFLDSFFSNLFLQVLNMAVLNRMKHDGCFSGFDVYDAFQQRRRMYRLEIALYLEDLKGLPNTLCCRTTGATQTFTHIHTRALFRSRLVPVSYPFRTLFVPYAS